MKKLILMLLLPFVLVSCSTDTLDWMYSLTSKGKENVLFHGDLERLSDGVLEMTQSTSIQSSRTFSTVLITAPDGNTGNIIGPFTDSEEALLYSLVVASQNQSKYEAVRARIAAPVEESALIEACQNSVLFYNSLLSEMLEYLSPMEWEYAVLFSRVLEGFVIAEPMDEFTYKDVIALKTLNTMLTAFLSYEEFYNMEFTPQSLAYTVLTLNMEPGSDLNAYTASVTAALGEARNIVRTIGDGPVLTASAVASVLDVLLELL